jgi:hypothetical protein
MDSLSELNLNKMVEMAAESIPCAVIQIRALIVGKERSGAALASILISCCATGFTAAQIFFDWGKRAVPMRARQPWYLTQSPADTSPTKRQNDPRLAGSIPDTNRGLFFVLLTAAGALQIIAKSLSSALMYITSPLGFFLYVLADHVIFQLYLVARGDHTCFPSAFNTPLSIVFRFGEKLVVDFTSCWNCR